MADVNTFDKYEVDDFNVDYSQYGDYGNYLIGEDGKPIDYNNSGFNANDAPIMFFTGGWAGLTNLGTGLSKDARGAIIAAQIAAESTMDAAILESQTAAYVAKSEVEGMVAAGHTQAIASMYSDDKAFEGIAEQCKTDIAVAQMEFELGVLENETELAAQETDRMNAEANIIASNALVAEAEAEQTKADAEADEVALEYLYDNGGGSWG